MSATLNTDHPTLTEIAENPTLLEKLNAKQLRVLWQYLLPKKPIPPTLALLRHELAFTAQAKIHGDLNSETRVLIRQAMRFVQSQYGVVNHEQQKEQNFSEESKGDKSAKAIQETLPNLIKPKLASGTLLIRKWQGVEHKVTYQNKQFTYQGKHYRSLTKIAEVITGTHWSGPRFFGLTTLTQ